MPLHHPVLSRDAAPGEPCPGDPVGTRLEEVGRDIHAQLLLQQGGILGEVKQTVVQGRPGRGRHEPVGADHGQVAPGQVGQVPVEPPQSFIGKAVVLQPIGIGPFHREPERAAIPVEVAEVNGEERSGLVDGLRHDDPRLAAEAVDRLRERRAGASQVVVGDRRVVGQGVEGEETQERPIGRVGVPQVVPRGREHRDECDEGTPGGIVGECRRAGLDPAPDQLLIGVCRPLLDVLGRHLVLRDPLEEVRLRGLPRCDEWWIAHVLRQELGLLQHVEIAPLRALAMVAAEAVLLEHAPGLPGQGGRALLVLRIAPRRARSGSAQQPGQDHQRPHPSESPANHDPCPHTQSRRCLQSWS